MMSFENFAEYVRESIHRFFPPELKNVNTRISNVNKNNITLTSIMIDIPGSNVSPSIYLNDVYNKYLEEDFELDECVRDVAEKYLKNMENAKSFQLDDIFKYEMVKSRIIPRLVSAENNDAFLSDAPHRLLDGLAVMYYIPVTELNSAGQNASIRISYSMMEQWGITEDELYSGSISNLEMQGDWEVKSMREILIGEMGGELADELLPMIPEEEQMFVLSNREKFYGAAMLLNSEAMNSVVERFGDVYILPSSVHETIILKKDSGFSLDELEVMVTEVNATQVAPEERLSDHVFLYDSKTKEIYRADHEAEHRKNIADASVGSEEPARTTLPHATRAARKVR